MRAEKVFDCDATLGEGASWDTRTQRLWWVDILGKRLFCGDPATLAVQSWKMPAEVGASLPAVDGRRIVVLRDRVEWFSPEKGIHGPLWCGDEPASNRFNDAGIDSRGNLWITSMDFDALQPTGQLWRVTADGRGQAVLGGYAVLNGPVFSPDVHFIYFCDTMNGRVLKAAHDPDTGVVSQPDVLVDLGPCGGLADGMAVDEEGCVWLARITAGRVSRYSPDGVEVATIAVPVPMVTSLSFGGEGLATLYMTTARILLSEPELAAYPESGSVFAVQPGVAGHPSPILGADPE